MGMLERSEKERLILRALGWSLALRALIYMVLLITASSKLSSSVAPATYDGNIGPLHLFQLSIIKEMGNTEASIGISSGSLGYFASWMVLGAAYISWKFFHKRANEPVISGQ